MALPQFLDELTPEQQAEVQSQTQNPVQDDSAGQEPIDALTPEQYLELWTQSKDETLNPVQWAKANPDRAADPAVEAKLADINALARERGFKFEDINLGHAVTGVKDMVVGLGKWAARAVRLPVETAVTAVGSPEGPQKEEDLARLAKEATELGASTELGVTGLADMGRKLVEKGGKYVGKLGAALKRPDEQKGPGSAGQPEPSAFGLFTAPLDESPEMRVNKFRAALGRADMMEKITKGEGTAVGTVTGDFAQTLEKMGHKVDPETVAALAAGDPVTFLAFPGGFKVITAAGKQVAKVASRAQAVQLVTSLRSAQRAAAAAAKVENQAARNLATQKAAFIEGGPIAAPGLAAAPDALRAAQAGTSAANAAVSAAEGAVQGSIPARAVMAADRGLQIAGQLTDAAGNLIQRGAAKASDVALGTGVGAVGTALRGAGATADFVRSFLPPLVTPTALRTGATYAREAGKAIQGTGSKLITGGESSFSPRIRLLSDLGRTAPDIAAGAGKGFLLMDVPLAAATSESPEDTAHMPVFGATLGALGRVPRAGQRIVQSQLIKPVDSAFNTSVNLREYTGMTALNDATRASIETAGDPQKARWLSAIRQFVEPTGAQVHWISDAGMLENLLRRYAPGAEEGWYREAAQQRGVTLPIRGEDGAMHNVVFLRDVSAAPHESFHVMQDAMGSEAMKVIDNIIWNEYAPIWDDVGQNYVSKFMDPASFRQYVERGEGWQEAVIDIASGTTEWRNTLTPEQVESQANLYINRELSAEVMDTVLRARGPELVEQNNLLGRVARIMGKTMMGLGIEPFQGMRSEGQGIPVTMRGTEAVANAAREGIAGITVEARRQAVADAPLFGRRSTTSPRETVSPRAETAETAETPAPATPEVAATEAREIASRAPTTPAPRGTRSQREILEDIANSIESRNGLVVDYASAPGEPAGSISSNRKARRAVIEAFRAMPVAARALWEKVFYPERVVETRSSGTQVLGWSPEVFASNAHKLAKALIDGKQERLSPYPLDAKTGSFTEHGWRQLYEDAKAFMSNQQTGRTGAGETLVVPTDVTARGFRAPEQTGGGVRSLSQSRADVISALFGIKLPSTPRITGKGYPRNLAGQEVAEATMPGRVSVPVEPRAPFSGERAAELGVEGREIMEVNPFRAELEAANIKLDAIEAIQRLNVNRIADVTPLPAEAVPFRANEFTLQAGFQPKEGADVANYSKLVEDLGKLTLEEKFGPKGMAIRKEIEALKNNNGGALPGQAPGLGQPSMKFQPRKDEPRAIKSAAVRLRDGRVFEGLMHPLAFETAQEVTRPERTKNGRIYRDLEITDTVDGYTTNTPGEFLTREEAYDRALELKQIENKDGVKEGLAYDFTGDTGMLETDSFNIIRKFQPTTPKTEAGAALEEKGFWLNREGFPGYRTVEAVEESTGRVIGSVITSSYGDLKSGKATVAGADVKREFRKQGIAEALYREVLTDLQEDGVHTVTGHVISEGPLRIREKLLPGTKFFSGEQELPIERAIEELPDVKPEPGKVNKVGITAESPLPADAKFTPKTETGKKLEEKGFKIVREDHVDPVSGPENRVILRAPNGDQVAKFDYQVDPGDATHAEILMVRTSREHQKKGYAEALYREALTDLQEQGVTRITGFILSPGTVKIRGRLLPETHFGRTEEPLTIAEAIRETEQRFGVEAESELSPTAKFQPKPNDEVRKIAEDFAGRELPSKIVDVNPKLASRIADYYENAKSDPSNQRVSESYDALIRETQDQWDAIESAGYELEAWRGKGEPYKSSDEMTADVRDNKHLYFLPTEGAFGRSFEGELHPQKNPKGGEWLLVDEAGTEVTGGFASEAAAAQAIKNYSNNPMLADSHVAGLKVNDVFRAVHDFFGHAKEGLQFGPKGELNAWREHSEMYSPEAQGALAAETLAQNSWVNYGKHLRDSSGKIPAKGEEGFVAPPDRPFAEQKNIVIPDELISEAKGRSFLGMKFQPKEKNPRAIRAAATRSLDTDAIYSGRFHGETHEKFIEAESSLAADRVRYEDGFVTNEGEFLTRAEALERAESLKQISQEHASELKEDWGGLESVGLRDFRRFQPTMEEYENRKNRKVSKTKIDLSNAAKGETFEVTHYSSNAGLTKVDPKFFGKGKATPTDLRGAPKSYFFVKGSDFGQDANLFKDAGLNEYNGNIVGDKIYDLRKGKEDTLGWRSEVNREKADDLVMDAGYDGMILDTADGRQVVAMFKPVYVAPGAAESAPKWKMSKLTGMDKSRQKRFQPQEDEVFIQIKNDSRSPLNNFSDIVGPLTEEQASYFEANAPRHNANRGDYRTTVTRVTPDSTDRVLTMEEYSQFDGPTIREELADLGARFQPGTEELGMTIESAAPGKKEPLNTKQMAEMTQKAKREYYPEAIVPKSAKDKIQANIIGSPLFKRHGKEDPAADAFATRLVNFAREYQSDPAYTAGTKWYSEFVPILQKHFGKDAQIFAELLAATSPNTNPQVNFGYAYDALRSMQTKRFTDKLPKFEEGLAKVADGSWEAWYANEVAEGKTTAPKGGASTATFMAHWIDKFDLKPRQSNGQLYGMHGVRVLQVLARRWMDQNAGPKTQNFVGNLLGTTHEATIDVWAQRTMRWAGYEGFEPRWRILAENGTGVSDPDFAFSQLAFRRAAKEMGMKPDELQGGLWFAEKKRWADNGWARLDLGDFRTEMERVPKLEKGFLDRTTEKDPQLALDVEPRKK